MIDPTKVEAIIADYNAGMKTVRIIEKYRISPSTLYDLVHPTRNKSNRDLSAEIVAEVIAMYGQGKPAEIIAAKFGFSSEKVRSILRRNNVLRARGSGSASRMRSEKRSVEILEMFKSGQSLQEIGNQVKLSRERVRQILRGTGYEGQRPRSWHQKHPEMKQVIMDMAAAGLSSRSISAALDVTEVTLRKACIEWGVSPITQKREARNERYKKIVEVGEANPSWTTTQISEALGCPYYVVLRAYNALGIRRGYNKGKRYGHESKGPVESPSTPSGNHEGPGESDGGMEESGTVVRIEES